ncbi:protein kinase [Chondrus crispus]|uniref:Protein kinase n=1 Tax=Chondrus crispus TaxID=2769 RepID=R7Q7A7_CHOCR|nr:protein kinase [Chondrus crispus]CDF33904.1 protein kinase [Chondrus crispus]|eukprot:XP_005713723.1 protein kinase [Chondrus crispus]
MPSYPYPPSPYSAAYWSQSQDQNYRISLQLPPTRPHVVFTYTGHTSTDNVFTDILPNRTSFVAWDSFASAVQQARDDNAEHNTNLSSEELLQVMGTFVGAHVNLTGQVEITDEASVSGLVYDAYCSVAAIHRLLDSANTRLRTAHRAKLPSALFRFGGSPTIDFVFMVSDLLLADVRSRHRLVAVEVKRARFPLTARGVVPNTPAHLAELHNTDYKSGAPAWYIRMMSQALTYAMHTKNGCVIVTNHNHAMFMKIEPTQNHTDIWKLQVKVSKLYKCNAPASSFHAVLAILRKSIAAEDISSSLKDAFRQLQGQRLPARRTRSQTRSATLPRGRSLRSASRRSGSASSTAPPVRTVHDATPQPQHVDSAAETVLASLYQPQLIRELMESSDNIITADGHSAVLRSRYNELDVAVKYWNCATRLGLRMLLNEIDVYEEVVSKHSHLLGTVLPRLVALWKQPPTDAVIVSEYVGEALTRRTDSSAKTELLLGSKVLDTNDCRLLQDAAFEALEKLHSTGLRHRDVHERNIRATREVGERGDVIWKVWFIDLGLASLSGNLDEAAQDEDELWRATYYSGPAL